MSEIEILKNKLKQNPNSTKAKAWRDHLASLEGKNLQVLDSAKHRDIVALARNSSSTNSRILSSGPSLASVLEDYAASVLDSDVGAVRTPDSVTENTALYHSVMQIPIRVDPTVNAGAFSGMVTPTLGSDVSTRNFFVAIPNGTSSNYSSSSSFLTTVNGTDIRVDPEAHILLSGASSQNTFGGSAFMPRNSTAAVYFSNIGISGVNNSGFSFTNAGVQNPAGFTASEPVFIVPSGSWFNAVQLYLSDPNFAFGPNANWPNTGGNFAVTCQMRNYNFVNGLDVALSSWTVSTPTGGSPTYTAPSGNYFNFVYGSTFNPGNAAAGEGPMLSVVFYTEFTAPANTVNYFSFFVSQSPTLGLDVSLNLRWDVTTTPVTSLAFVDPNAILQKYRVVSQKIHFRCTLSDFNNSGQIALNLLQGSAQDTYFSTIGGNALTFDNLSNNNLPMRTYSGKLSDGFYGYWVPDMLLDVQLRSYADSLAYSLPFFAYAGNWTPTGASPGPVTIGYLRVVTNYEFTTTSRLFTTMPQEGSDALMQAVQSSLAKLPKVMENPTHDKTLKSMVASVGSGVKSVLNFGKDIGAIGKNVGTLLSTVGML